MQCESDFLFYQSGHLFKEVCQLVSRVLTTYGHNESNRNETKWNEMES